MYKVQYIDYAMCAQSTLMLLSLNVAGFAILYSIGNLVSLFRYGELITNEKTRSPTDLCHLHYPV